MRVLAVIPARAGSKGIPRKNIRLMNGRPLIGYAITNALRSTIISDVVVTSDCEEILAYSLSQGVEVVQRGADLSGDAVPLDPVVFDAVRRLERQGSAFDVIVTLQPTSPLLTVSTLDAALMEFLAGDADTAISVVNRPHLGWVVDENGKLQPTYEQRRNRQQLPAHYVEAGAFLISRRSVVSERSRIGNRVAAVEVPRDEAIDIDDIADWVACESRLKQKSIVFRADGYRSLGMGHIYRALGLALQMIEHSVTFVSDRRCHDGIVAIRAHGLPLVEVESDEEFIEWLGVMRPDVVVNDRLDTTASYVQSLKACSERVVTFEDLGPGAHLADAVINELYEGSDHPSHFRTGKDYACLRDEFMIAQPQAFSSSVQNVFVMFGGADPLNLTERIYRMAQSVHPRHPSLRFTFVLGLAYGETGGVVDRPESGISVLRNVRRVSEIMRHADLAFTSQGRSTFELASLGVPSIVLAQNEREQRHAYAQMNNGFVNLGLGSKVTDCEIESTFEWLLGAPTIRREMRELMLRTDLRRGTYRVRSIILGEDA